MSNTLNSLLSIQVFNSLFLKIMDKKRILVIFLKTLLYAITLLLGALGVSLACTSCTTQRSLHSHGAGTIVIHDTTYINHDSGLSISSNGFKFK